MSTPIGKALIWYAHRGEGAPYIAVPWDRGCNGNPPTPWRYRSGGLPGAAYSQIPETVRYSSFAVAAFKDLAQHEGIDFVSTAFLEVRFGPDGIAAANEPWPVLFTDVYEGFRILRSLEQSALRRALQDYVLFGCEDA